MYAPDPAAARLFGNSFSTLWTMKRKPLFVTALLLLFLAASGWLSFYLSAHALTVSRYSLPSPELTAPVRIVQLTDLHNSVFGEDNIRLTDKVAAQEPDLILITGDLLNQREERTDIAENLIRSLAPIAPVYVSYGNHERAYEELYGVDIRHIYTEAGAIVLEYDWQDVTVNEQPLRLGGIYGYCLPAQYADATPAGSGEAAFLTDLQNTDRYSILMCHMPVCWIRNGSLDDWDVDLVLAGHAHGGQVRFPLIGGLWAPDQGWFPGRVSGIYSSDDGTKHMVLSRGLGNTEELPRFNNIPETLVLDLLPG